MSAKQYSSEQLISLLSHRPSTLLDGVISISEGPAKHSPIQRPANASSFGLFKNLPFELLYSIFSLLDFQSLSRVSRVCLQGNLLVELLPAYREIKVYAPHALTVLGRTGLASQHSAAAYRVALRSERCILCGKYGAFLFLLTCERCCYKCLSKNPSFWAISTGQAEKCFGLTRHNFKLRQIPIMHSIPGVYFVRHKIFRRRRLRLISVKMANELAVTVHGSTEAMKHALTVKHRDISEKESYLFKWLQEALSKPLHQDLSPLPTVWSTPNDNFCGMASIPFPSLLPDNTIENGLWCRGCERMFMRYRSGQLSSNVVLDLFSPGCHPLALLMAMHQRAWSKAEFLEHITRCPGAPAVVPDFKIRTAS